MLIFFAAVASARGKLAAKAAGASNFLLSYVQGETAFDLNADVLCDPACNLLVDSGAFSAWATQKEGSKKRVVIDFEEYIEFCHRLIDSSVCGIRFVNLDAIPGSPNKRPTEPERAASAELGWDRFMMMRTEGIECMHVFHQHEDFSWLERLAGESDYIGISPANDVSVDWRDRWLDKVFSIIGTSVRTHAFGVTATELLAKYPFYSADSTTWMNGAKFGSFVTFQRHPVPNVIQVARSACGRMMPPPHRDFGGLIDKWMIPFNESVTARYSLGAHTFKDYERYVTRLWEGRGVTWPVEFTARILTPEHIEGAINRADRVRPGFDSAMNLARAAMALPRNYE